MSIQKQLRRDTSGNLAAVTPADGEPAYNTTDDRLHMGDGSTLGGIPHLNFRDDIAGTFHYALTTGSADAYVLSLTKSPSSYTTGMRIRFKASFSNTGTATINVDSLGAKTFNKVSSGSLTTLSAGDIISGVIYEAFYDGTVFQVGVAPTVTTGGLTTIASGSFGAVTLVDITGNPWGAVATETGYT